MKVTERWEEEIPSCTARTYEVSFIYQWQPAKRGACRVFPPSCNTHAANQIVFVSQWARTVLPLTFCPRFLSRKVSVPACVCLAVRDFIYNGVLFFLSCCVRYVGEAFCVYPSFWWFRVLYKNTLPCLTGCLWNALSPRGSSFFIYIFFLATTCLSATVPAAIYYARSCRSLARQRRHIPILGVLVKGWGAYFLTSPMIAFLDAVQKTQVAKRKKK